MRLTLSLILIPLTASLSVYGQQKNAFPALNLGANFYSESFWMADGAPNGEDNYNYLFNNNGWNIEGKYTLLSHQSKNKKGRKRIGSETLNIGVNGYFYGVENQSSNSILTIDIGLEKEFFFGLQLFGKVGAGILHTKFIPEVYSVDIAGNVIQNNNFSVSESVLPASFGLGWNFESLLNIPISLRARTMYFSKTFGQYSNYKSGLLLGVEYRFKNLNVSPIKEF